MRRRLFTRLSALSLVLCVATALLWVRSYWVGDWFYRSRMSFAAVPGNPSFVRMRETAAFLMSGRGGFGVEVRRQDALWRRQDANWGDNDIVARPGVVVVKSERRAGGKPEYPGLSRAAWWWLGFGYWSSTYGIGYVATSRRIWFPMWLMAALFAVLPAMWLKRRNRARRRVEQNRCASCGYDLRATPDRCPECGAVPKRIQLSP